MPAPLDPRRVHGLDRNRWAYWHALCAAPHIAYVHFGAAIELLLRQYAATKPDQFRRKLIDDTSIRDRFFTQVSEAIAALEISQEKRTRSRKMSAASIGSINAILWTPS